MKQAFRGLRVKVNTTVSHICRWQAAVVGQLRNHEVEGSIPAGPWTFFPPLSFIENRSVLEKVPRGVASLRIDKTTTDGYEENQARFPFQGAQMKNGP